MSGQERDSASPEARADWTATVADENRLAEHDERQQAVAFGDVLRMPRRRRGALRPDRHRQFERRQHDEAGHPAGRNPAHADPGDLQERDAERVAPRRDAPARDPPPPRAATARPWPAASPRSRRSSARLGTRSSNIAGTPAARIERAGDLHEHREPVRHVVAVVGRREPREVHPRPPDGEEHHQVADEPVERVRLGDRVVQAARRLGDRDDEDRDRRAARAASPRGAARAASGPSSRASRRPGSEGGGRTSLTSRAILSAGRSPVYA